MRHDQQFFLEQVLDVFRLRGGRGFRKKTKETVSFYVVALIGWGVNVGVATLVKTLEPSGIAARIWVNIVAPVCGIAASFLWDFFGYKYLVFKKYNNIIQDHFMYPLITVSAVGGCLFLRVVFGAIMIVHGFPKLKNLKETGSNFANMGFRPGMFWGTLAALLESFGGLALILGIVTVPVAAFFVVEFLVIVIWKIGKHAPFVGGWEFDLSDPRRGD